MTPTDSDYLWALQSGDVSVFDPLTGCALKTIRTALARIDILVLSSVQLRDPVRRRGGELTIKNMVVKGVDPSSGEPADVHIHLHFHWAPTATEAQVASGQVQLVQGSTTMTFVAKQTGRVLEVTQASEEPIAAFV